MINIINMGVYCLIFDNICASNRTYLPLGSTYLHTIWQHVDSINLQNSKNTNF